ncbi:MAG: hypothetical protein IJR47_02005 [Clostridia bacterium]|nr:hypothetical protein [Clostridia bacterium]
MNSKINFKSKGFMMLISVFFAVVFWGFVMMGSNTTRVSDIRNVAVNFRGADKLKENGLVITYKSKEFGSMRVEGNANVVSNVTVNNVHAYVDLQNITEPGTYDIAVDAFTTNGAVVVKSFSPAKITVEVERIAEKQVPLEIVYDRDISSKYWVDYAKAQTDRVTVVGGESFVQEVVRGVITVDTSMLVNTYEDNPSHIYEASLPISYVDRDNKAIEGLEVQSSIVSVNLMSKKKVKIDASGAVVGAAANGYQVNGTSLSVNELEIVGKKDILDKIDGLSVEPVNIDGATANVVRDVKINTADGVMLLGMNTVRITIEIGAAGN